MPLIQVTSPQKHMEVQVFQTLSVLFHSSGNHTYTNNSRAPSSDDDKHSPNVPLTAFSHNSISEKRAKQFPC